MAKIVFKYKVEASYGWSGKETDYSITIMDNNKVIYNRFLFDSSISTFEEKLTIDKDVVDKIKNIIQKYQKEIDDIPKSLYNNSLDGAYDIFSFYSKKIKGLNVMFHEDAEEYANGDELLLKTLKYENQLSLILKDIKVVLNEHNIELFL